VTELDARVRAGLAAQRGCWRHTLEAGAARVGWKMGRTIGEVEALLGAEPVIGHLTTASMLGSGAVYGTADDRTLRAETELALVLGHDVPAEADAAVARDAIAGLSVAFELVDVGPPRGDVEQILEANVFHRAFGLGEVRPADPTGGRHGTLSVNGRLQGTGPLLEDYADTVRDAAALLGAMGEGLQAGDRIIAGAIVHVPVRVGDQVGVEIDGLGRLDVTIARRPQT
jgi:2-oxo-hept-3-ene-1,7-dioate hydratase